MFNRVIYTNSEKIIPLIKGNHINLKNIERFKLYKEKIYKDDTIYNENLVIIDEECIKIDVWYYIEIFYEEHEILLMIESEEKFKDIWNLILQMRNKKP